MIDMVENNEAETDIVQCQYCGGENTPTLRTDEHGMWTVRCPDCGTLGPEGSEAELAVNMWNDASRQVRARQVVAFTASALQSGADGLKAVATAREAVIELYGDV